MSKIELDSAAGIYVGMDLAIEGMDRTEYVRVTMVDGVTVTVEPLDYHSWRRRIERAWQHLRWAWRALAWRVEDWLFPYKADEFDDD